MITSGWYPTWVQPTSTDFLINHINLLRDSLHTLDTSVLECYEAFYHYVDTEFGNLVPRLRALGESNDDTSKRMLEDHGITVDLDPFNRMVIVAIKTTDTYLFSQSKLTTTHPIVKLMIGLDD